jgi:modulator of FtsH protease
MTTLPSEAWATFFSTAAEAAATLAGLVIVAVSVNIQPILKYKHLPTRGAATVSSLILILISAIAGLIPQSSACFGAELVVFGFGGWTFQVRSSRHDVEAGRLYNRPRWESRTKVIYGQIQILPFIIAGVLLLAGNGSGLYWMAGGIIAIFIFSLMNTWILLVEILR